jgi:hypothetical protein
LKSRSTAIRRPVIDVADLERRGQAVAGRVGDRDPEQAVRDRDEVEVVAPHELRRSREARDLDRAPAQRPLGQDRHLNPPRLLKRRHVPVLTQLLIHRQAKNAE